jgi:ribosomal protein S18 acetylase RimI-like enzyme
MIQISRAVSGTQLDLARALFQEYADRLGLDLAFQGFEQELAGLPGKYAPPEGALLLARWNDQSAGCVALRRFEAGVGELKRLYVRPAFRGHGIGRALSDAAIEAARAAGYARVRLDTIGSMVEAVALYRSLGFQDIPPYRYNPDPQADFLELELVRQPAEPVAPCSE